MLTLLAFFTYAFALDKPVLVAGPELAADTYQEILIERSDLQSPVEWAMTQQERRGVRNQIFEIADRCLDQKSCPELKRNFQEIRQKMILSPKERQMILEIYKKTGTDPDCHWGADSSVSNCHFQKLQISKLGLISGDAYAIFIDGQIFTEDKPVYLAPQKKVPLGNCERPSPVQKSVGDNRRSRKPNVP